ncbi:AarF/ABC1/UbiB kinase family protein [Gloeocapsa sp. PCC 73106]|uniref:ABC1 kinase family protein n=1 Tax=Gloeocapsa sp. PCC 73106 TaxID=102232 RepID=UPI0002AC2725|nr:AarF/ABC1/UbiB kinase family protein [Gloeocapsa sp. PCC 73106]ELR96885.1 putative unusual protein kinase [Gloeocapsa sp. PCC 73106]
MVISKPSLSVVGRQLKIFRINFQFLFYLWWDKLRNNQTTQTRHRRARWLVKQLLDLGPTFIKIGQALSTRADLIPIEYIQALGELQDNVPPFSHVEAIAIIEAELGNSLEHFFIDFEQKPLASASLGQVHKAKLPNQEEIVIKVQRPGLKELFNLDFEIIHGLVRFVNRFLPNLKEYELEEIYQEFFKLLYQEIDYIHEGKNAERFRANFRDYPKVKVPKVYWDYTTQKILTLEYLPGIKINDLYNLQANGINTDKVIELGICSYLKQLLEDGFFQSDPHPGNMAVTPEGAIIFYDFGTMTEVKSMAKDQMVSTFFAVLRKDTDSVVQTLIYMGLVKPVGDLVPIKRIVAFLLDKFRDRPVDVKAFEEVSQEIYLMFEQQPFRLPAQMTFVLKSLTTLDGVARVLNPEYNLLAASQPFVQNIAFSQGREINLNMLVKQAKDFWKNRFSQSGSAEALISRLESRLESGELQIRVRSLENELLLKRINLGIKTLVYVCLLGFSLVAAILLLSTEYSSWAIIPFSLSGLWCLFFLRCFFSLIIQERISNRKSF